MTRLLSTRFGALGLAALLAITAVLLVVVYVKGYQSDVNKSNGEVTVLVANQTIPEFTRGTQVIDAKMYRETTVPAASLVDGAVTNPDQLKGLVARNDVYPGEQITTNQFIKSDTTTVSVQLQQNQRAVDFPVEPGQGMVGRLQPGDHVDVVANFEVVPINPQTGLPITGGQSIPVTKTIASNVLVMAVPDTSSTNSQSKTDVLTLAIDVIDVQRVVFSQEKGDIYFVLRPPGSADPIPTNKITDVTSVLTGKMGDDRIYTILGGRP